MLYLCCLAALMQKKLHLIISTVLVYLHSGRCLVTLWEWACVWRTEVLLVLARQEFLLKIPDTSASGVLQSMWSQSWTRLSNWTELSPRLPLSPFSILWIPFRPVSIFPHRRDLLCTGASFSTLLQLSLPPTVSLDASLQTRKGSLLQYRIHSLDFRLLILLSVWLIQTWVFVLVVLV